MSGAQKAATLTTSNGLTVLVDEEDIELVSRWSWYGRILITSTRTTHYAVRATNVAMKRVQVAMHRFLLSAPAGMYVDHRNFNGLDNRKANLRLCTNSQNVAHSLRPPGRSGYRGVREQDGRWRAVIKTASGFKSLGMYATPQEAAMAYDRAAIATFGEFARPNFPDRVITDVGTGT